MNDSHLASLSTLRDFVDVEFARRLEMAETLTADRVTALQRFAPEATAEVFAGGTAVYGGLGYPSNQIVGMGLHGAVTSDDLDHVEEFFRSRGVPSRIVVSPLADGSLVELLAGRAYAVKEFNSVLIRRLDDIQRVEPATTIRIEPVTAESAALWEGVIRQGYAEMAALPEGLLLPFATLADSTNYLASVEGVPAGGCTGAILREARIAALYGSATVPEWRGRGVQTALINRRLWEGRQAGCEHAVVCTWPGSGSQRNMERRGFRVAYTKIVMVRRWPESGPFGRDDGH